MHTRLPASLPPTPHPRPPVFSPPARSQFTDTALGLSLTLLNSLIDLVSFSGILYSIYPPLFAALLAYSIGGTLGSIALGKVRARVLWHAVVVLGGWCNGCGGASWCSSSTRNSASPSAGRACRALLRHAGCVS